MAKKLKDKNAPKRPLSGFLLYGNGLRAHDQNINNLPMKDQVATIEKIWNDLDEKTKQKYTEKSAELHTNYLAQHKAYEKTDEYIRSLSSV